MGPQLPLHTASLGYHRGHRSAPMGQKFEIFTPPQKKTSQNGCGL
jgi:hypothetical protein